MRPPAGRSRSGQRRQRLPRCPSTPPAGAEWHWPVEACPEGGGGGADGGCGCLGEGEAEEACVGARVHQKDRCAADPRGDSWDVSQAAVARRARLLPTQRWTRPVAGRSECPPPAGTQWKSAVWGSHLRCCLRETRTQVWWLLKAPHRPGWAWIWTSGSSARRRRCVWAPCHGAPHRPRAPSRHLPAWGCPIAAGASPAQGCAYALIGSPRTAAARLG